MQLCTLTIVTTTDGKESTVQRAAQIRLTPPVFLRYREEAATVEITLKNGEATLSRTGDYSLYLPLKENVRQLGSLGIGAESAQNAEHNTAPPAPQTTGNLPVTADKIAYSITKTTLLASIKYRLHFGTNETAEDQTVSLRISAKLS